MYLAFIQAPAQEGLALGRIIGDLPHDGAAIFIYVLTAVSVWLIWQGSRTRDTAADHSRGESAEAPTPVRIVQDE